MSSRRMSLLPRATLHGDSEHVRTIKQDIRKIGILKHTSRNNIKNK
jgi:hypothetical protein